MSITKFLKHLFLLTLLIGLASPSLAQTTYTDRFAGSVVASIGKQPVVAATTANIGLFYSQMIDGVTVSDHTTDGTGQKPDRVLVKNQSDQTTNGIYVVSNTGAWYRAQDFSGPSGVVKGQLVTVNGGSTNQGFWTLTTADPISIDGVGQGSASSITFSQTVIPIFNAALTNGNIIVGSATNLAAAVPISGDCTLANTGALTCTKANGVTTVTISGSQTITNKTLTSPALTSPTVTGTFTATGLVTNADLVNAATTVNGVTCTLGSTCAVTTAAASIVPGVTTILSGTSGKLEYNNSGTLGETSSPTLTALNLSGLTASELVATDGSKNLTNITALPTATTATTGSARAAGTNVATQAYVDNASHFGTWTTGLGITTIYQAVTDVIVTAWENNSGASNCTISCLTDSNSTPTTNRMSNGANYANGQTASCMMPVRKGDYWEVINNGACTGGLINSLSMGN